MATQPNGAPYPVGTDRVMDGDNAIQALAKWGDDRALLYIGQPATTPYAFKVYAASPVNFDPSGVGRYDWAPTPPKLAQAVWVMSNYASDKALRLWSGSPAGGNGFNSTSVWLAGGPANGSIGLILFLVLDKIA
ncbi:MAG TPA: hypothetical protein VH482_09610 [Thermomicrobiales bacterium]|jgi:hypothetical protein